MASRHGRDGDLPRDSLGYLNNGAARRDALLLRVSFQRAWHLAPSRAGANFVAVAASMDAADGPDLRRGASDHGWLGNHHLRLALASTPVFSKPGWSPAKFD